MNDMYHYRKTRIQQESDPIRRRDLIVECILHFHRDKNPDIDAFRKWLDMQFQICMQEIQQPETSQPWKPLYDEMTTGGYITCSPYTFNHVMEYHQLPPGETKKIMWLKDAAWWKFFTDHFGFKLSEFKRCFEHHKGKPFHSNNKSPRPKDDKFREIIKKFSDQKTDLPKA